MYCGQLKEQLMLFHSLLYSTSMLFLLITLCFWHNFSSYVKLMILLEGVLIFNSMFYVPHYFPTTRDINNYDVLETHLK
jgi:hypothetical protein